MRSKKERKESEMNLRSKSKAGSLCKLSSIDRSTMREETIGVCQFVGSGLGFGLVRYHIHRGVESTRDRD